MKKMTGKPFDQMYLVQMDAYVKNDQEVVQKAKETSNMPNVSELGMRVRSLSDDRRKTDWHVDAGNRLYDPINRSIHENAVNAAPSRGGTFRGWRRTIMGSMLEHRSPRPPRLDRSWSLSVDNSASRIQRNVQTNLTRTLRSRWGWCVLLLLALFPWRRCRRLTRKASMT